MHSIDFTDLLDFIENKMRMSHIYQPVMLIELLESSGTATTTDIAKAILSYDQSQIEYYEKITTQMPGRVLRSHGVVTKEKKLYELAGGEDLTDDQRSQLVAACRTRLEQYQEARGNKPWAHRKKSSGYVPGTLRYKILKRARFRCELCGISAEEKALEVDHIIPRNKGGSDDISNLQALCYSCNATKRDRDDTDFRAVRASYDDREAGCLFCEIPADRIIHENELAYAIRDGYPVTDLHTLVIPKRHVSSYFDLGQAEINACHALLREAKAAIECSDAAVTGFNVGINNGEDAGQTIFHCHIHLIPRRKGDVEEPRGGVRHIILGKGDYR